MKITGRVISLKNDFVKIKYIRNSACFHCKSKDSCVDSERKEEEIEFKIDNSEDFKVGDNVNIIQTVDINPVILILIMYGIPVLFMVVSAMIGQNIFKVSEIVLALIIILSLFPSFFICKFLEKWISGKDYIKYKIENVEVEII
ncbi:MAG: SoxR reducing system RseC family protein [Candidatus Muirbacterium halophilum]|nr:SoxR reducing system RseC family protein [Candidatus Muirbacterium halophilum]MCK9475791.1 SoxR reducing system RseC family protein [Candidatus Muirbacterium halophilum]